MHPSESFANVTEVSHYEFLTSSDDAVKMHLLLFYHHLIFSMLFLLGLGNAAKATREQKDFGCSEHLRLENRHP